MLVEKLQRVLFGAKSEKVLRQIDRLELQLEEPQAVSAIEESKAVVQQNSLRRPATFADLYRNIFRAESIFPVMRRVPTAAAGCADSATM
nr:transposase [Granulicella aggregans]